MAMKGTGNFSFPSVLMKCSRLILLVLMLYFITPAGSTSIHRIISQNCAKGSWLGTMITFNAQSLFSALSTKFYFLLSNFHCVYFYCVWKCYSYYDYSGSILLKNQCYAHFCRSISFGEILGWITEIAIFILKKWANIEYFMYFNLAVISLTIIGILLFMTVFLRSIAGSFYQSWPDGHVWVPWVSSGQNMCFITCQLGGDEWSSLIFPCH